MKFTEILEELKKGEKVTREEWEKVKTYRYKYIKLEHGDCVAYLKDGTVRHKGEELTNWIGCVFGCADFTAEDWKIYKEKKTNKKWEPQHGEKYYYMTTNGNVGQDTFNTSFDKCRLSFRNVFKTAEEARKMVEKIKIINKLRELSNVDFNSTDDNAYVIVYDRELKKIQINFHDAYNELPFNIHFATKEDCQKAIETIGEENLKKYYFDVEEL